MTPARAFHTRRGGPLSLPLPHINFYVLHRHRYHAHCATREPQGQRAQAEQRSTAHGDPSRRGSPFRKLGRMEGLDAQLQRIERRHAGGGRENRLRLLQCTDERTYKWPTAYRDHCMGVGPEFGGHKRRS